MMTFVNMNDPGLLILPTHRVVHSLIRLFLCSKTFSASASRRTTSKSKMSIPRSMLPMPPRFCAEHGRAGTALLAVTANRAFLLHSPKPADRSLARDSLARQQSLDVVQLHKCLLEGVLNLSEESIRNQQNLSYLREAPEALAAVRGESREGRQAPPTSLSHELPVRCSRCAT